MIDVVSGFLDGPRARQAFVLRCRLDPPWAMAIRDEAPLALVAVTRGRAAVWFSDGEVTWLEAGDVAIFRGPDHYFVADDPATVPSIVIHPGEHCTDANGVSLGEQMDLGVRTWGNHPDGQCVLLTAAYMTDGEVGAKLLAALPRMAVIPAGSLDGSLTALFAAEAGRDEPGQQVVLDRLADLALVASVRAWFGLPGNAAPAWYGAELDPIVGPALRLLHHGPQQPWTVGSLAAAVHSSRAALARRFTELTGQSPMAYLQGWRLALAADLLRAPQATVSAVAGEVGYSSPFTFSAAFKRVYGVSPSAYRQAS